MQSLGRVRKVDILLIKMTPFPLPLFSKEDWMRSNFFCWQVLVFPFIFPSHTSDSGGVKWKEKTSFARLCRTQEAGAGRIQSSSEDNLYTPLAGLQQNLQFSAERLPLWFLQKCTSLSYIFSPLTDVISPNTRSLPVEPPADLWSWHFTPPMLNVY